MHCVCGLVYKAMQGIWHKLYKREGITNEQSSGEWCKQNQVGSSDYNCFSSEKTPANFLSENKTKRYFGDVSLEIASVESSIVGFKRESSLRKCLKESSSRNQPQNLN